VLDVADRHDDRPGAPEHGGWRDDDKSGADRGTGSRFWGWQPQRVAMDMQHTPPPNGFAVAALITGILGLLASPIPFLVGVLFGMPFDLLAIVFGLAGVRAGRRLGGIGLKASATGLGLGVLGLVLVAVVTALTL
jgi:hypothetical protein